MSRFGSPRSTSFQPFGKRSFLISKIPTNPSIGSHIKGSELSKNEVEISDPNLISELFSLEFVS